MQCGRVDWLSDFSVVEWIDSEGGSQSGLWSYLVHLSGKGVKYFNKMDLLRTDFPQFEKPGRREDFDYPSMAKEAG